MPGLFCDEKVPLDQDAGEHDQHVASESPDRPGRPPPFRPNPPSELAQKKGNTNGLSYPRGVRIRSYPTGRPSGVQFSPRGRTAPSERPSGIRQDSPHSEPRSVGRAKRGRPMITGNWFAADAVRNASADPEYLLRVASLHAGSLRSHANRCRQVAGTFGPRPTVSITRWHALFQPTRSTLRHAHWFRQQSR